MRPPRRASAACCATCWNAAPRRATSSAASCRTLPPRILDQLNAADLFRGRTPDTLAWGILPAGHRINDPAPVFPRILSEEEKAQAG